KKKKYNEKKKPDNQDNPNSDPSKEDNSIVRNNNDKSKCSKYYLWHLRLGHISKNRIKRLINSEILNFKWEDFGACEACIMGKMTRASFPKVERSKEPLAIIHSDICGKMLIFTKGQKVYFITFIDDYSRFGYVYLFKHKSEGFDVLKRFKTEVENQLNKTIKVLRTDRGREYTTRILNDFCKEHGIIHQYTMPYTPQQNGVAERRNRTLMNMVRSMMAYSDLPMSFWGEALHTAVYLLNHSPSKAVTVTPYELWTGRKPSLRHLAGCNAHIKVPNQNCTKLQPKSTAGIFIGYSMESKGHRFYDPQNDKLMEMYSKVSNLEEDPKTYKEAINCPQSKLWVEAMREELNSMRKNKVKWKNIKLDLLLKDSHKGKPEGFGEKGKENIVCKLNRSIYGLKQASRQWYILFDNSITSYGFSMTEGDHCIYTKIIGENFMLLSLYVDDILIASNDKATLTEVKAWLSSKIWEKPLMFWGGNT
ncbi:LOW QUALITY PROTEIN: hypothetical protein U9M48_031890, partial [Paspalum notatum var. saurae]